jgi:putative ABC transport system ATP-binding protein
VQVYGQTTVMVTHDPGAACIADRTLFIADGLIVRQMQAANPHDLLGVLEEITTR